MANIKSAKLRIKKNAKRNTSNRYWSGKLKDSIKALKTKKSDKAVNELKSTMDKAVSKGIISKNKASRIKSKLTKK